MKSTVKTCHGFCIPKEAMCDNKCDEQHCVRGLNCDLKEREMKYLGTDYCKDEGGKCRNIMEPGKKISQLEKDQREIRQGRHFPDLKLSVGGLSQPSI